MVVRPRVLIVCQLGFIATTLQRTFKRLGAEIRVVSFGASLIGSRFDEIFVSERDEAFYDDKPPAVAERQRLNDGLWRANLSTRLDVGGRIFSL